MLGNVAVLSVFVFLFLKAKQRAEVLQSTQRFFSEQQQNKQIGGKTQRVAYEGGKQSSSTCPDSLLGA